ncbi:site-specific integrase [Ktedonospora formicarum]|uniref:Uncharacterized protein n=1 Tax=Ktedonospora formicarum TaxID=2778364 RepID=A0A8J3IAI4_9CHLR|nr:site-specific integrase [Ktedonospora formicarum]GHO48484.1 hypothetical protein KSX_66470 [Ktedonospora formicarum]
MGRAHRKSLIKEALERFDSLMAIGESRGEAKARRRRSGESTWAFSTGRILSYKTRSVYQEQVLQFLNWVRACYHLSRLQDIDRRAEELACAYLRERVEKGYSPWTLATERSALRLFFSTPTLAQHVTLPARRRDAIRRSRQPEQRVASFQPANWQPLLTFLDATGLRRREAREVRVSDVLLLPDGRIQVWVWRGKGGKTRYVPILAGKESQIQAVVQGRADEERIFPRLPSHLDIHAHRRRYAQALYQQLSGRPLPPTLGRLPAGSVDHEAVLAVSRALGHNREDVVLTYYLR